MSGFKIDGEGLLRGLNELEIKVRVASELFAKTAGNELEQECKENAEWQDRTGLSRNTIDSEVLTPGNKTEIRLRGNTPQFKYLEGAHEKKYAILWPTVKKNINRVRKAWAKVIWK